MKVSVLLLALLGVVLFVASARADCDEPSSNPDDGEVKQWFKTLGCKISKSAGELSDAAKPYTGKISDTAKDIGSSVAQKYDELKHKLTDDPPAATNTAPLIVNAPTEKVPLAPLNGGGSAAPAAGVASPAASSAE